jgi:UDP-glucose 6-dehydrogenase
MASTYKLRVKFEILLNLKFLVKGTAIKDLLSLNRVIIGSVDTASS